jgi:hypothetical protein
VNVMTDLSGLAEIPGWLWVVAGLFWLAEIALIIWALVVLFRTPEERVQLGKRWIWVLIILFLNPIGAIVFLIAGRKPAEASDPLAQGAPLAPTVDRAAHAADVLYGPGESHGADTQSHGGEPQ